MTVIWTFVRSGRIRRTRDRGRRAATAMTSKRKPACLGAVDRMMYSDMVDYLPDDILVKMDRASMSVGLEMRRRCSITASSNWLGAHHGRSVFPKQKASPALRKLLSRRLPEQFISVPKRGFGVP